MEEKTTATAAPAVIKLGKNMFSRLLYTNPVCILTSHHQGVRNAMIISWLTAANNHGLLVASMNLKRHSYTLVKPSERFVLSVPVKGMEDLVLEIGGCSGRDVDKLATISTCAPGWGEPDTENGDLAVAPCVAHMVCVVQTIVETDGHALITAQVQKAWVKGTYWKDNKLFCPVDDTVAPYLTFFGTKTFGYVRAT